MVPFSNITVSVLKIDMQLIFKIYGQFLVLYDHEYWTHSHLLCYYGHYFINWYDIRLLNLWLIFGEIRSRILILSLRFGSYDHLFVLWQKNSKKEWSIIGK